MIGYGRHVFTGFGGSRHGSVGLNVAPAPHRVAAVLARVLQLRLAARLAPPEHEHIGHLDGDGRLARVCHGAPFPASASRQPWRWPRLQAQTREASQRMTTNIPTAKIATGSSPTLYLRSDAARENAAVVKAQYTGV